MVHAGGRPEKYTEEWLEKEAIDMLAWADQEELPYLREWCVRREYDPNRIAEFAKKSIKFSGALSKVKMKQEKTFLMKGLTKEWDASTVKYAMARVCDPIWKACHYKDNSDKDTNIELVKALAEIMGKSKGVGACE
jgi:hypothetical protein